MIGGDDGWRNDRFLYPSSPRFGEVTRVMKWRRQRRHADKYGTHPTEGIGPRTRDDDGVVSRASRLTGPFLELDASRRGEGLRRTFICLIWFSSQLVEVQPERKGGRTMLSYRTGPTTDRVRHQPFKALLMLKRRGCFYSARMGLLSKKVTGLWLLIKCGIYFTFFLSSTP